MVSKWRIEGIEGYVFGEDCKLYRLPFRSGRNNFGVREIKKQYPNRYRINGEWWSEKQLKDKLYIDESPIELFKTKNLPF